MANQVPGYQYDSYEFRTHSEADLLREVDVMEDNSKWTGGIMSKQLKLDSIDGPMFVTEVMSKYAALVYDVTYDTASCDECTKLLLLPGNSAVVDGQSKPIAKCIRNTARASLYETAKLNGSALGEMHQSRLADTLNNGLHVAKGTTLMLERYGKVTALHSDANGGYRPMAISMLLKITMKALSDRFGTPDFKFGLNRHDYTYAVWDLPDVQNELVSKYQAALENSVSFHHAIAFMPAVRFSSSDTAASSATLVPQFKLPSGVYFRLVDGIQVKHKRSTRQGVKDGLELFEEEAGKIFAKFEETAEIIKKMGETEIWNPVNCLVGICNKLKISKKYADAAREEVERFAATSACCSMHDIYLSMAETVGHAERNGASQKTIRTIEESIAKVLTMDWEEFDVGGVVAWGNTV